VQLGLDRVACTHGFVLSIVVRKRTGSRLGSRTWISHRGGDRDVRVDGSQPAIKGLVRGFATSIRNFDLPPSADDAPGRVTGAGTTGPGAAASSSRYARCHRSCDTRTAYAIGFRRAALPRCSRVTARCAAHRRAVGAGLSAAQRLRRSVHAAGARSAIPTPMRLTTSHGDSCTVP
jgi:hypothetical protein